VHPTHLSARVVSAFLLVATVLNALQLLSLYAGTYAASFGFGVNLAFGICLIPVRQMGSSWTLAQGADRSQVVLTPTALLRTVNPNPNRRRGGRFGVGS